MNTLCKTKFLVAFRCNFALVFEVYYFVFENQSKYVLKTEFDLVYAFRNQDTFLSGKLVLLCLQFVILN